MLLLLLPLFLLNENIFLFGTLAKEWMFLIPRHHILHKLRWSDVILVHLKAGRYPINAPLKSEMRMLIEVLCYTAKIDVPFSKTSVSDLYTWGNQEYSVPLVYIKRKKLETVQWTLDVHREHCQLRKLPSIIFKGIHVFE